MHRNHVVLWPVALVATSLIAAHLIAAPAEEITLQKINDTLFLSGPSRREPWALNEDIQRTKDRMEGIMNYASPLTPMIPTREMTYTRLLMWNIFGPFDCQSNAREHMEEIKGRLLNEERRARLYRESNMPMPSQLRLEYLMDEVVERRLKKCNQS